MPGLAALAAPAAASTALAATAARPDARRRTLPRPPAMPAAASAVLAKVYGIQTYCAAYGTAGAGKAPTLLIHGGRGQANLWANLWANQGADLARDHPVITADTRDHDRPSRIADPSGYDLMAADDAARLDFTSIRQVGLVFWSGGGTAGLKSTIRHPDRLDTLFTQAATIPTDGVNPGAATNVPFALSNPWRGGDLAKLSPEPAERDAFVAQISNLWTAKPNRPGGDLCVITAPTAIVLGDHDRAMTGADTEPVAAVIPETTTIPAPDACPFAMPQGLAGYPAAIRALLD